MTNLEKICNEVIEASEKATPGLWTTERYDADNGYIHYSVNDEHMLQVAFFHEDTHPKTYKKDAELVAFLRNQAPKLAKALLVMEPTSKVINEGDTVFGIAVSRVENCRCSHETCDLCILSRAIITQVEVQRKARAEAEKILGGGE